LIGGITSQSKAKFCWVGNDAATMEAVDAIRNLAC